jgi:hypothetical protein
MLTAGQPPCPIIESGTESNRIISAAQDYSLLRCPFRFLTSAEPVFSRQPVVS